MSHKHPSLIEQNQALSAYFDALLREESTQEPAGRDTELAEGPQAPPVIAPPVVAPVELPQEAPAEPAVEVPVQTQPPAAAPQEGPPEWAEERFQALLFKAGGLTLAVPLAELSGIQVWSKEAITPMPGHVAWYLGLMNYREHSVPVIDTAQLVLPEDRLARLTQPAEERISRVVFIDGGRWGLACDQVDEVVSLDHDQVRWRTSRTRRRWLAGTVIEHMCAIIDPPAFAQMLASGIEDRPDSAEADAAPPPSDR
ncbi:MAG: chemotaxis protein CheW [Pseudomonadota bacterium]